MVRERAFMSGYAKIAWIIIAALAFCGISTYLEPWTQEYELKTAMSLTCSDLMKYRFEGGLTDQYDIKNQWASRLGRTGVKAKPQNVKFNAHHDKPRRLLTCRAEASYETSTEWAYLTILKPDLPQLKLKHHVVVKKEVADAW